MQSKIPEQIRGRSYRQWAGYRDTAPLGLRSREEFFLDIPLYRTHRLHLGRGDRMQRNFESMRKQVDAWQRSDLTDVTAKVVIYEAFVEWKLEAPKQLARTVHDLYFEPKYEEFRPRTIWSLSNAFTSAFKGLDPIPQGDSQAG
jgi:hypothetical protein